MDMEVIKQFTKDQYTRIIQDKIDELSEKDYNMTVRLSHLKKEIEESLLKIKDGYTQIREYQKDLEEMLYRRLDICMESLLSDRSSILTLWNFRYGKQNIIDEETTFFIIEVSKYVSWKKVPEVISDLLSSFSERRDFDAFKFRKILSLAEEDKNQTGVVSPVYPILFEIRNYVTHLRELEKEVNSLEDNISEIANELMLLEKELDFTNRYTEETYSISLKTSVLTCLLDK
jgi:prefoldin subunit 5